MICPNPDCRWNLTTMDGFLVHAIQCQYPGEEKNYVCGNIAQYEVSNTSLCFRHMMDKLRNAQPGMWEVTKL